MKVVTFTDFGKGSIVEAVSTKGINMYAGFPRKSKPLNLTRRGHIPRAKGPKSQRQQAGVSFLQRIAGGLFSWRTRKAI